MQRMMPPGRTIINGKHSTDESIRMDDKLHFTLDIRKPSRVQKSKQAKKVGSI